MAHPANDPLRESFKRELDALAAETAQSPGPIPPDRVAALNGLAKLIEARDSLKPRKRNWSLALVFVATLLIVSVLLFVRVRETEIELDVSLTQLSFSFAQAQVLCGALNLSALGVSGLESVEFSSSRSEAAAVSLLSSTLKQRTGTVTLAPLPLPAGSHVTVSRLDGANQFQLSTSAAHLSFQATADGPVIIGTSNSPPRPFDFKFPQSVSMHGGPQEVSLDLTFPSLPRPPLTSQLKVRDLFFSHIDQFEDSNHILVRRLSTIISGSLSFESLNGEELRLRTGEELQFERSEGELRSLDLGVNQVGFKFHGRVQGMFTGVGEGRRSIMPTWLETLKARHGLSLLWGASLYLFGLLVVVLRWWGMRP
jgi:hypothetical protein